MVKHEFGEDADMKRGSVRGSCEWYKNRDIVVGVMWLHEKADIGHLVHECFHMVHEFMQSLGFTLADSSEEAYAYLIQHMFKKTKGLLK